MSVHHLARLMTAGLAAAVLVAGSLAAQSAQAPPVSPPQIDEARPPFGPWLLELRAEAAGRGIGLRTIEAALAAISPLEVVVDRDRTQAELTLTLDQYLKRRLPSSFVRTARTKARQHRTLLTSVERQYGVAGPVIAAIWGLESNFGRFSGIRPTIPALVTLAYEGRRSTLFREELFAALTILDSGEVAPSRLKGSWAGAMGQPQFMPSTFLKDAVDGDGDGHRDIWTSIPDVLGSIANYLKTRGWIKDQRWGREVRLGSRTADKVAAAVPLRMTGGCQALRNMTEPRPLAQWSTLGVTLKSGGRLPRADVEASLVRIDKQAFLVYRNYEVLLAYNCAHTYALSVALLADRIR